MNKFRYDIDHEPPLPVCDVALSVPSTGLRVPLSATIDTGADGTIIPVRYLREIGARRAFEANLRSQ